MPAGSCYLDSQPLRANASIIAFPFGEPRGSVAVVKNSPHAIAENAGVITMATAINGLDISPFRLSHVAVAAEDGAIGVFDVSLDGISAGEQLSEPTVQLLGHDKRALGVFWHAQVDGLLASHDGGKVVKIWV
jgi:hypothetical protein